MPRVGLSDAAPDVIANFRVIDRRLRRPFGRTSALLCKLCLAFCPPFGPLNLAEAPTFEGVTAAPGRGSPSLSFGPSCVRGKPLVVPLTAGLRERRCVLGLRAGTCRSIPASAPMADRGWKRRFDEPSSAPVLDRAELEIGARRRGTSFCQAGLSGGQPLA
jgi:hypothetical protein